MAGFAEQGDEDDPIAQINIIPFVDIVLVLLIVFLLTANLIAKASINVDLPQAAHAGDAVPATVNIVVEESGALDLDGAPITREAMKTEVARRFAADANLHAVIAADRAVRYERVVEVIDVLKGVGVGSFALNLERQEQ